MSDCSSALYKLQVSHHRRGAVKHGFAYSFMSLLLDLDELPKLRRELRLFSWNAWGPIAHRDGDHGPHDGSPLRPWVEARLAEANVAFDSGSIRLLAMPRILGSVFNPLSIYYCHAKSGALQAVIYEVHNTFGQHHSYVFPVTEDSSGLSQQSCAKNFYVSPFIPMQQCYRFRLRAPGETLSFTMQQGGESQPLLFVRLSGQRVPLSDATLGRALLSYPVLTWKVLGAIHWQAFRLWRKGAVFHPRAKAETRQISAEGAPARLGVERETL